jgi:phosphoribosylaminoimidazole-succinocarboxamide synthase
MDQPMELSPDARGKVRDIYDLGDDRLLLVASDRISAFDVVLPDPIPYKGEVLTQLSMFWFALLADVVPNHFITDDVTQLPEHFEPHIPWLTGRSMIVKKAQVYPVECIVRGYLAGSGWAEFQKSYTVCGIPLPHGLVESEKLPHPLFTPSTKAEIGDHDENISPERMRELVGEEPGRALEAAALALYTKAADHAAGNGIIIADTKFEFGLVDGQLTLVDEVLTPDSSRFWPADSYCAGGPQASFDKQFVRDWLVNDSGWDKKPPAPSLPVQVTGVTSHKYIEAFELITGTSFVPKGA